jgi:chromosomal replication initiator protein
MNQPDPKPHTDSAHEHFTAAWKRVQAKLRFRLGEATFNSWVKPLSVSTLSSSEVSLEAPTRFIKEWVLSHYLRDLTEFWQEEHPSIATITVRVGTENAVGNVTQAHEQALVERATHGNPNPNSASLQSTADTMLLSSPLDQRFTFEHFIVGKPNALAHAAARSIADATTVNPGSNPLFLHGGVGLGKTHLMHAIAWHIRSNNPERKVIYLSAEKFMYMFIRALRNKEIMKFKEQFRSVDVLMIDDVQFICGKESTQEEFFHTFNALIDNNRQLIISADRSPCDLDGMEERIRSRLGWGLVADIHTTTYELRLGILQAKVEQQSLEVPETVLEFIAHKITSNIRELEGALNRVVAHCNLVGQEITLENTQMILADLLRANQRMVNVDDIKKAVCEHCNIRVADMHSERRSRHIARPRQMAMYLSKKLTTHSLPEIGRKFGGRDHTTVMHAVKRIEELSGLDQELQEDLKMLTRLLQS